MNWHQGLRRISAVFWGLCGALIAGVLSWAIVDGDNGLRAFVYLFLCLSAVYLFYRLTNWIIGGFFSSK